MFSGGGEFIIININPPYAEYCVLQTYFGAI
jgi:hypothetical protein